MLGLQYQVIYKQGSENRVTDALSRVVSSELQAITTVRPQWLTLIADSYTADPAALALLSSLAVTPDSKPHFTLKEGIIRYKGRIWVGVVPSLHQRILSSLHGSPIGGHSGVPVTLRRVKQFFVWTGLKSAVHAFVTSCAVCQQSKPDRARYPGLLQPLPVPSTAWAVVS